jgi:hypothetical protein
VITPDICYYNNFFHDNDTEFHALNSAYVLYSDNLANEYLVGILNSDAVQFYMRRTAPQYGNDYLRYVTSYLFEIPIPDPTNNDTNVVNTVRDTTDALRDLGKDYRQAKNLLENPHLVFEESPDIERSSLSFAGYVETMSIGDGGGDVSIAVDGNTVRLNVQDDISFISAEAAEHFAELLRAFDVNTIEELESLDLPETEGGLNQVVERIEDAERVLEDGPDEAEKLEASLNDAVYSLYGFDSEHRKLIEARVDKPKNLLEAKVRT